MGFTLFMMGSRVCLIQSKVWGYPWRGRYIETARSSTTALKRIIEGGEGAKRYRRGHISPSPIGRCWRSVDRRALKPLDLVPH